MDVSQRAILYLEGRTFTESDDLINTIKVVNNKYPSLSSTDWIEILEMLQIKLMIGFVEEKYSLDDLLKW